MEGQNRIIFGIFLSFVSICISCKQDKKITINREYSDMESVIYNLPCIDSVLQVKCGTKESMKLVNVRDYMELVKRNEKIKEWLSGMNEDELSVYTINNNVVKYLILSSTMIDATGLATNFYHWLFIDITNEKVLEETLSLSKDRRSCFVEDNIIHFIVFKYGDEFYHGNRDYLNLPITTVEYIWDGNKLEKISSMNLICSEER